MISAKISSGFALNRTWLGAASRIFSCACLQAYGQKSVRPFTLKKEIDN
jgi:hypothetical protein